jgi:hypothetical protein
MKIDQIITLWLIRLSAITGTIMFTAQAFKKEHAYSFAFSIGLALLSFCFIFYSEKDEK